MNANRRKQINEAIDLINRAHDMIARAYDLIDEITDAEQDALDNLPESIQESERGEMMSEAIENLESARDIDFEDMLDEIIGYLEDAQA